MIEIAGKYNTAKVFTNVLEDAAREQIERLCSQEAYAGSRIRIMPDVHAGAGCTIGTTMTITDKVTPNLVGVDIGCGVMVVKLKETKLDFTALDCFICERIPAGFHKRDKSHVFAEWFSFAALRCKPFVNEETALYSLGTLGGGNHFIEVDRDAFGNLYLLVHTGSRHFGLEVAKYYQLVAQKMAVERKGARISETISMLKSKGREKEIEAALAKIKSEDVPADLAFVSDDVLEDYLNDMEIAQGYATLNRAAICHDIMEALGLHSAARFQTVHNYIDIKNKILRKGAVSAQKRERCLILINMRDGSLLCLGKGNPDWNYSAPHGAGRVMSRTEAKRRYSVEEYQKQMEGVYTTTANKSTLDECPMAYKGMEDILDKIGPTVEIVRTLKPVYNFKAWD